jgi:hypothetical protein
LTLWKLTSKEQIFKELSMYHFISFCSDFILGQI